MIESMDDLVAANPRVAGYRLERRVATMSTSEMWLGYPELSSRADAEHTQRASSAVAIKVPRSRRAAQWPHDESIALSRVSSPHVAALVRGVCDRSTGAVLIFRYLAGPSLDELLAMRRRLTCAEIATIIIALSRALQALSNARVDHRRLTIERIRFDECGTPVITGFGRAISSGTPTSGVRKDVIDFAAIVQHLVDNARDSWPGDSRDVIGRLLRRTGRGEGGSGIFARWESALFGALNPEPVDLDTKRDRVRLRSYPETRRHAFGSLRSPVLNAARSVKRKRDFSIVRGVTGLSTRTRAISLACTVATGGLCVALCGSWSSTPKGASEVRDYVAESGPDVTSATTGTELPRHTENDGGSGTDDVAHAAVRGADPIAATNALLGLRSDCIRQTEPECVDVIDEPGSVQWTDDRQLILESTPSRPADRDSSSSINSGKFAIPRLVSSLGAAAVLALDQSDGANPTSVLVIKGDAGWRIREIFASSG